MAQVPICVALTLQEELHQLAQGGFGGPMGSSSGFYEEVGLDRCAEGDGDGVGRDVGHCHFT